MKIFDFPVTCNICGGEAVGTIRTAAASWFEDSVIRHIDPRVCKRVLAAKKDNLEKREAVLAATKE